MIFFDYLLSYVRQLCKTQLSKNNNVSFNKIVNQQLYHHNIIIVYRRLRKVQQMSTNFLFTIIITITNEYVVTNRFLAIFVSANFFGLDLACPPSLFVLIIPVTTALLVNKTKYLDHLEADQFYFFYCWEERLKKIATSGNKLLLSSRRINWP